MSAYLRYGEEIDPYVDYVDLVLANVGGVRMVVGVQVFMSILFHQCGTAMA